MSSKIWLNRRSIATHSQGFSLVEVLIAILMIAAFLATAMQALVAATAIKVRSEEISEATSWMQEDLEALRFEANRLDFDTANRRYNPSRCGDYGVALETRLESLPATTIYANNQQPKQSSIGGRRYLLDRVLASDANTLKISYTVFQDIDENGIFSSLTDKTLGTQYAEIVPDATFACPLS